MDTDKKNWLVEAFIDYEGSEILGFWYGTPEQAIAKFKEVYKKDIEDYNDVLILTEKITLNSRKIGRTNYDLIVMRSYTIDDLETNNEKKC